jgi:SAM-dependent methyltransferase
MTISMSSGFSRASKKLKPILNQDAEKYLKDANGVLQVAQARFFNENLRSLHATNPELYSRIERHHELMGEGSIDLAGHQKLVEVTWDTMAAYLPVLSNDADTSATAKVEKRLKMIAKAVCGTVKRSPGMPSPSILDVGCGDGALLPYLIKAGASNSGYIGIDLSRLMVDAARSAHPGGRFQQDGFLDSPHSTPPAAYDAVLFNGSLQFFPDVSAALRRAVLCLRPGGRVVFAHVNGAAFVTEERRGNPATVVSSMPSLEELALLASELGARVIPPEQLGWRDPAGLDTFYLAALDLGPA